MKVRILFLCCVLLGVGIWFSPVPEPLPMAAWRLFAIFTATIAAVVSGAASMLLASILALVVAVFSGTLEPEVAYSMVATDALIAPAVPSNTARSGVLFPIVYALAESNASHPGDETRHRLGAYLMLVSMVGLGLSSALWLTAMAANPIGVALLADEGVEISFGRWFIASSLPTLTAMLVLPWLLYRLFPPGLTRTPGAPDRARVRLQELGPMAIGEWITLATFLGMVGGWALGGSRGLDATAVAFAGLAVLLVAGVLTLEDIRRSGDALETLIWFGILYMLSTQLDQLGFMQFIGDRLGHYVDGLAPMLTYALLVLLYVLIHYLFVSQSAHLLALFGVFLGISQPEVPMAVMGMMLLFATNFFSPLTPQASSANVIFVGRGYLRSGEVYRYGGLAVAVSFLINLVLCTTWLLSLFD